MYLSCQSQYKICNLWNLPNEWHGCVMFVSFCRLNCTFVYWSYCFWTFVGISLHQSADCRDLISFKFAIQNIKWKSRVILLLCPQFLFFFETVCCSTLVPIVVVNWIQLFIFPLLLSSKCNFHLSSMFLSIVWWVFHQVVQLFLGDIL